MCVDNGSEGVEKESNPFHCGSLQAMDIHVSVNLEISIGLLKGNFF